MTSSKIVFCNEHSRPLILASKSETRQKLMTDAGLIFHTVSPSVDEEMIKESLQAEGADPADQVMMLAKLKAERVSAQYPDALVIGADQILVQDKTVYSKTSSKENARQQLQQLRGQRHQLMTGQIVALAGSEIWRNLDVASMTMRPFGDSFLEEYLNTLGAAVHTSVGGYHIEGIGLQLFSSVMGDWTTIKGLSMLPLINFLREHDVVGS